MLKGPKLQTPRLNPQKLPQRRRQYKREENNMKWESVFTYRGFYGFQREPHFLNAVSFSPTTISLPEIRILILIERIISLICK